tara:strand:- start:122 stop:430 length:309 start_codon:yes stop_codon:yes gene_type:complete
MKKLNYNTICKKADNDLNQISADEYELDGYRNNPITLGQWVNKGMTVAVFKLGEKVSDFVGILVGFRYNAQHNRYVYRLKKVDKQIDWPNGKGFRQEAYITV